MKVEVTQGGHPRTEYIAVICILEKLLNCAKYLFKHHATQIHCGTKSGVEPLSFNVLCSTILIIFLGSDVDCPGPPRGVGKLPGMCSGILCPVWGHSDKEHFA